MRNVRDNRDRKRKRAAKGTGKGNRLAGGILLLALVLSFPSQAAKSPEATQTELERQGEGGEDTPASGPGLEAETEASGTAGGEAAGNAEEGAENGASDTGSGEGESESGAEGAGAALAGNGGASFTEEELSDDLIAYGELEELIKRGNATVKTAVGSYDTDLEIYQEALDSLAAAKKEMTEEANELKEDGGSEQLAAQYEANASQLGASVAQMNRTIKKLTGVSGQKSLKQSVNSMVKAAQTLMGSYNKMAGQRAAAEKQAASAQASYEKTQSMYEAGMATKQELLTAEQSYLSAQISLQSAQDSEAGLKRQLAVMIGRNADAIQIAEIPEADVSVIDSFNLEEDKKVAITSDSSIQSLRRSRGGGSSEQKLRAQQIEEAKSEKNSAMDALYSDMLAKRQAYEAAVKSFESAEKEYGALQTRYQSGLISRQEYLQGEAAYEQQKAARAAANIELNQAIAAYQWEIKGI